MALKRPSHLDDPPAASSSEEEEVETSSEDEDDEEEEGESSSEEEEQAKIDSLPSTPVKPQSKKPDPPAPVSNSKPQTHSSSSGSESESETESGSTPDPNVKPLASKPMEPDRTPVKATKPRSKPSSARSSATKKRPNGEAEAATPSKRVKKKDPEPKSQDGVVSPSEDSKKGGDEKKLFQRLWSDENEIELLRGMLDYTALRGADPAADAAAFFEFVKKSLHVEVTKAQLVNKMKRLRKKYNNNAGRGKKGKDPTFSKPHEQKTYELSKKIWGPTEATTETEKAKDINNGKDKAKDSKNGKAKGNSLIRSLKEELNESGPVLYKCGAKMEIDGDSGSESCLNGMLRFDKNMGLDESVIRHGLNLIGEEKKMELVERWKEVELAELELFVKRTELIKDQARLILEAYKDH